MAELVRGGFVETNIPFGSRVVEYGVRFRDGRILAIDSKFPATRELEMVNGDGISDEERASLSRDMVKAVTDGIDEVAQYIDSGTTLPFAVMAIPDSLVEYSAEFVNEASRRNVVVAGHSSAPSLVAYFLRVQEAYAMPKDIEELKESLRRIEVQLSRFDDDFFANRFDRPP
jgi:DNA anti-recombination protein RmuC